MYEMFWEKQDANKCLPKTISHQNKENFLSIFARVFRLF